MDPKTGEGRVIGGAGGKLQHLRLDKLRSPEEWRASAKKRAEERRAAGKAERERQAEQAKELGVQPESVAAKREQGAADVYKIERERIQRVAKALGWDEKALTLDDEALESMPPQQRQRALAAHHRQLHARAQEALRNIREGLVKSATARAEAGMGVAGDGAREAIGLTDLLKQPAKFSQPGYAPQTSERLQRAHQDVVAHVHGLDADGLRQEAGRLEEAFQAAQSLPGEPVSEAAKKRGTEAHRRFAEQVERRLSDGDLYGARKSVADAIVEQAVLRPEQLADTKRRLEEKEKPELAKMGHEMRLEMAAERRRISEEVRGASHVDQLPVDPTDYRDALELLRAEKKVRPAEERARAARQSPAAAAVEEAKQARGAIQIVSKEMSDEQAQAAVSRDIEDRLRENAARSLLRAYDGDLEDQVQTPQEEREHHLRQAVGIGAHQALANASLVFAEHGGLSREAVDVLGAGPAAQVLAAHLRARLSPEDRKAAVEAIGRFHADEVRRDTEDTLRRATESFEAAKGIQVPESVSDGRDLMTAMELTERKREFLEDAREAVGLAVGKFEATAALEFALQSDEDKPIEVKLPDTTRETMVRQLHALGLSPDQHYTWTHDGKNGYVELDPSAHEVLAAQAPDAATLRRNALIRDIKAGRHDEPDFVPPGFARRPRSSFEQHGQDLPDLARPFKMGADLEASLLEHVGSRVASGEPVWKILPSLNNASEGPLAEAIRAGKSAEYGKFLDKLAPTHLGRDDEALRRLHVEQQGHQAHEPDRWLRPDGRPVSDDWAEWKRRQEVAVGRDDGSADWRRRAEERAEADPEPEGGGAESPEHAAWEVRGRELRREARRAEGRPAGPADWQRAFDSAAEKFLDEHHPGAAPIHRQRLALDDPEESAHVLEALHRTIAPTPALKAALKNPGDMTGAERKALRDWHMANVVRGGSAASAEKVADLRKKMEAHEKERPEEFSQGLFGPERTTEHVEWRTKQAAMAQELADLKKAAGEVTWEDYAAAVGGSERALRLAAEFARGQVADQFAHHYERVTGKKLRTTKAKIADDDLHDYALDPEARARHQSETARQGLEVRRGAGGRAGADAVKERLAAAESRDEARELGQGTLLGGAVGPDVKHARTTLGAGLERQLAGLVDAHFKGLDPRWQPGTIQPIPDATMNGRFLAQQRILKAAVDGRKIGIGAGVGCLAGDTMIEVNRAGKSFKIRIDDLTRMVNGGRSRAKGGHLSGAMWDQSIATTVRSRSDDGFIRLNLLACAVYSGRKILYRLTTECGRRIRATADHRFLTAAGWRRLHALTLGDSVFVEAVTHAQRRAYVKPQYKYIPGMAAHPFASSRGRARGRQHVLVHRATVEANLNGLTYGQFVDRVRSGDCAGLTFLDPRRWHVHHKDENVLNNALDNLAIVTPSDHHREHGRNGGWKHVTARTSLTRIVAIEMDREEDTYDLCMDGDPHNFLANGFVVHNSGKTRISLGAFAQANHLGEAKRGLFAVPSAVVGQFATEAQIWLEPGKFNTYHAAGSSKADRMAAYRDPGTHMVFVGHEQLRDDLRDMVAAAKGWTPEQARSRIMSATPKEVDAMVSEALHRHGAEGLLDYYSIDEGHQTLNRKGKPDSLLAKISDSLMRQSRRANMMTGTMSKNDLSEVQDVLAKLDPARHGDRAEFLRRYDVGTNAAKEALRREIDNYVYTAQVDPGTRAVRGELKVPLHGKQKARLEEIGAAYEDAAELSRNLSMGLGDAAKNRAGLAEAMRRLYPKAFRDVQPEQREAVAEKLAAAAGTLRDTATYDAIHAAEPEENAKVQKAVELARLYAKNDPGEVFDYLVAQGKKRPEERADWIAQEERSPHHGKSAPGVMFVRSLDAVDKLGKALGQAGLRVRTFTGAMDARAKASAQQDYKAGKYDVMVVSDAGAAGLNLQRGRYSVQVDSPQTWKTHAQRSGRIDRVGQVEPEPHLWDLVGDHPFEQRARERLARKRDLHALIHDDRELADDTGLAAYYKRVRAERDDAHPRVEAA